MAIMALDTCITLRFLVEVLLGDDQILPHPSAVASAITQPIPGKQRGAELLNLHRLGFGIEAAKRFWSCLNDAGRQAEHTFLTMGVLFSFFYGGALAGSLWWVWMTLGRPFHPAWIVTPLAMILTADWMEHLIQLAQLRHYVPSNEGRIHNFWVQMSSCATMIKLWLTLGLYVSLVGFVLRMILTLSDQRLAAGWSSRASAGHRPFCMHPHMSPRRPSTAPR